MSFAGGQSARFDLVSSTDLYEVQGTVSWVVFLARYNCACIFLSMTKHML